MSISWDCTQFGEQNSEWIRLWLFPWKTEKYLWFYLNYIGREKTKSRSYLIIFRLYFEPCRNERVPSISKKISWICSHSTIQSSQSLDLTQFHVAYERHENVNTRNFPKKAKKNKHKFCILRVFDIPFNDNDSIWTPLISYHPNIIDFSFSLPFSQLFSSTRQAKLNEEKNGTIFHFLQFFTHSSCAAVRIWEMKRKNERLIVDLHFIDIFMCDIWVERNKESRNFVEIVECE